MAPVNPMEAKIQRGRRGIQKTPQKFSQFSFADGDDKFRPFLKGSKLSPDSFVENVSSIIVLPKIYNCNIRSCLKNKQQSFKVTK